MTSNGKGRKKETEKRGAILLTSNGREQERDRERRRNFTDEQREREH